MILPRPDDEDTARRAISKADEHQASWHGHGEDVP
jgi:hypothetical protein